jgi:hypothetical protein
VRRLGFLRFIWLMGMQALSRVWRLNVGGEFAGFRTPLKLGDLLAGEIEPASNVDWLAKPASLNPSPAGRGDNPYVRTEAAQGDEFRL